MNILKQCIGCFISGVSILLITFGVSRIVDVYVFIQNLQLLCMLSLIGVLLSFCSGLLIIGIVCEALWKSIRAHFSLLKLLMWFDKTTKRIPRRFETFTIKLPSCGYRKLYIEALDGLCWYPLTDENYLVVQTWSRIQRRMLRRITDELGGTITHDIVFTYRSIRVKYALVKLGT